MSDQTPTIMVVQPDTPSFLSTSVDLKKLLRAVSKESAKAIDVLVKLLESKDEKTRLTAATKLLEFQVTVADKISQDQMQRLIAQGKVSWCRWVVNKKIHAPWLTSPRFVRYSNKA
jgi:GTPase Era involved in 16S rRNA processing